MQKSWKVNYSKPWMFRLLGIVLPLLFTNIAGAQVIKGVVKDAVSQDALAYVHIGIQDTDKGTISKDDGTFEIDIQGISQNSVLQFSMLGYESQAIYLKETNSSFLEVNLKPASINLTEVVVNANIKYKTIKLGNYKNSKTTTGQSGDNEFGWGGEWGIVIPKSDKEYQIKDVNFHLRFNSVDSILFRVNIYRMSGQNKPGESLLKKPAFVSSKKNQKWISLNMEERSIWVDEPILVTMEWIRVWYADEGQNNIFYTHAKNKTNTVFHRENSFGTWKINERPPLAIYVNGLIQIDK